MKIALLSLALCLPMQLFSREHGNASGSVDGDGGLGAGKGPSASFTVTRGDFAEKIAVKWTGRGACTPCYLYRSTFPEGPYGDVGEMKDGAFEDKTAAPGIKYWYRILTAGEDIAALFHGEVAGHRKSPAVKGEDLDLVMRNKNKARPFPRTREQKAKEDLQISLLKQYYMNQIKLNLVIYTGASYVRRGDLLLIRNFDDYVADYGKSELYLMKKRGYVVRFFSRKLFRIFEELKKTDGGAEGVTRLIENSMVYCIRSGDMELRAPDGMIFILPLYEALGLSTEYFRDSGDWKSATIMVGSSNKKLMKMMRDAQSGRSDEQAEK